MSRMNIDPAVVENAGRALLLPIERIEVVNGLEKTIKNHYVAEIVSAREHTSSGSGKTSLKIKLAVDFEFPEFGQQRAYIEDYLSYEPKAARKLAKVVSLLNLNPKALDTDDFEGRGLVITIRHEEFIPTRSDGSTGEIQIDNKVDYYIDVYNFQPKTEEPASDQPTHKEPF